MRTAAHRAGRRLGRRGAVLSLKGVVCALYGYSLLVQPPVDQRGIRLLLDLMPVQAWGWLWIAAGVVAMGCAWRRQGRDWPGYPAVFMVVAPWSAGSLASWWLYANPRGWVAAAIWAAFGGAAAIVASWPEPIRVGGADER